MTKEPFIAHSEMTNEIYVICGREKYPVTEQVIKAMQDTGRLATSNDCVSKQAIFETIDDCNSDGLKGIFCSYDDGERFKEYIKNLPSVTPTFPKDATNGNLMTAMFPDIKIREHEKTDICDAYIQIDIWDFSICVSKDWWDEPYKQGGEA